MLRDMAQFMALYLVFFFGFSISFYVMLGQQAIDYQTYVRRPAARGRESARGCCARWALTGARLARASPS